MSVINGLAVVIFVRLFCYLIGLMERVNEEAYRMEAGSSRVPGVVPLYFRDMETNRGAFSASGETRVEKDAPALSTERTPRRNLQTDSLASGFMLPELPGHQPKGSVEKVDEGKESGEGQGTQEPCQASSEGNESSGSTGSSAVCWAVLAASGRLTASRPSRPGALLEGKCPGEG